MNVSMAAFELPHQVNEPDENQRSAGNNRKCSAPFGVQYDTAPCNQNAQSCRKQNMTAPRHACDKQCLREVPPLRPSCNYEWKPVCWNCSVQKGNGKTRDNER